MDRMRRIAVSALKQCQTTWLPPMTLTRFDDFLESHALMPADKYIAWCDDENTRQLARESFQHQDVVLLVGPEGDFSPAEIGKARQHGYTEVKLGNRRLRTETAGLYGCLLMAVKDL
jgi:16S rRNA (uracil1498-N3)-methyltransferase